MTFAGQERVLFWIVKKGAHRCVPPLEDPNLHQTGLIVLFT